MAADLTPDAHQPDRASRRRHRSDGRRIDPDPRVRHSPSRARRSRPRSSTPWSNCRPRRAVAVSTFGASGQLTHQADRLGAALHLTLDHVGFADLPALWPADIAADARTWITENIQAGTAHDGNADLVLDTPDTTPDVTLLSATGDAGGRRRRRHLDAQRAARGAGQGASGSDRPGQGRNRCPVRPSRWSTAADPIAIPYGHVTITGLIAERPGRHRPMRGERANRQRDRAAEGAAAADPRPASGGFAGAVGRRAHEYPRDHSAGEEPPDRRRRDPWHRQSQQGAFERDRRRPGSG